MTTGPCFDSWGLDYCSAPSDDAWGALTPEQREVYERAAVEFLWRWTGEVLGPCSVTLRPCAPQKPVSGPMFTPGTSGYLPRSGGAPWSPTLVYGRMTNVSCGTCGERDCGCEGGEVLRLPGPVESIEEITIDGEIFPANFYRLDGGNRLVRTDGQDWPQSQDMTADLSEPNTFGVTYLRGIPVPKGGEIAAGVLAVELFRAACNSNDCRLPRRVQTVSRQGVTVAMLDSFDDVDSGHTGIWIIDSWIASMTKPTPRSAVLSPDVPRRVWAR